MAHLHSVYDNYRHFSINPVTREIINESGKITLIQHDHNSERFTFDIPKIVDGHDMSKCNVVQVHYLNIEAETKTEYADIYEVDDLQVSPDSNDVVCCSWLISRNATQYVGSLSFVLNFQCVTDGEAEYAWSTAIYSKITVGDGINNGESAISQYTDILEQWRQTLVLANVVKQYTPEEAREELGALSNEDGAVNTSNISDGSVTRAKLANDAKVLSFSNKTVDNSAWARDTTYTDFPYRASVACSGVTADHYADVSFSPADVLGGIFCPVAASYAGGVYIYASEIPSATVTIPTIVCTPTA